MYGQPNSGTRNERHPHLIPLPPLPSQAIDHILVPIRRWLLAHHHLLSASNSSALVERRVRGFPPGPFHGIRSVAGGLQVCPARFHADATRSHGLVHRSVLGWCTRERHLQQDPHRPLTRVGYKEAAWSIDGFADHRRRCVGYYG